MNAAATKGYEKDVGSRTTFQSLYQRIEKEYKKPNKVLLVSVHTKELRWAARAAGNLHLTPSDVYTFLKTDILKAIHINLKSLGVFSASSVCPCSDNGSTWRKEGHNYIRCPSSYLGCSPLQ